MSGETFFSVTELEKQERTSSSVHDDGASAVLDLGEYINALLISLATW